MTTQDTKTIDTVELENKTETTTSTKKTTKDSTLEKQLASMLEVINNLQKKIDSLEAEKASMNMSKQPNIVVTAPSTDVTLVYMSDSLGVVMTNNVTLNCTRFGEEFVLSRSDFDAIVGKYRSWFDGGILAVSYKNVDVAVAKGLKTDKEYNIDSAAFAKMGSMTVSELEKFWQENPLKSHRQSIVTYFKRKFIEGDEKFRDRAKIDLLNRLTNGGFDREADELSGNYKIRPTEVDGWSL